MKPLLIYHANCPDGFGSAYAFWKRYADNIDYMSLSHDAKNDVKLWSDMLRNRVVWMVDIALDRSSAEFVNGITKQFLIIDHHITAMRDLGDLEFCKFDMNKSGAILAWEFCFPSQPPPKILQYIQDRDLHIYNMQDSKKILYAIDSVGHDFKEWDRVNELLCTEDGFSNLLAIGSSIFKNNRIIIDNIKKNVFYKEIKGYLVPVVNTPIFKNEVVNELAIGNSFAAGYHFDGSNYIFSLRSDQDAYPGTSIDVAEVASKFGNGGGHKHAAGFSIRSLDSLKQ